MVRQWGNDGAAETTRAVEHAGQTACLPSQAPPSNGATMVGTIPVGEGRRNRSWDDDDPVFQRRIRRQVGRKSVVAKLVVGV